MTTGRRRLMRLSTAEKSAAPTIDPTKRHIFLWLADYGFLATSDHCMRLNHVVAISGVAAVLLSAVVSASAGNAGSMPAPARVARLIAELGSDEFAVRESASEE